MPWRLSEYLSLRQSIYRWNTEPFWALYTAELFSENTRMIPSGDGKQKEPVAFGMLRMAMAGTA
jgi:hypothetical protein